MQNFSVALHCGDCRCAQAGELGAQKKYDQRNQQQQQQQLWWLISVPGNKAIKTNQLLRKFVKVKVSTPEQQQQSEDAK